MSKLAGKGECFSCHMRDLSIFAELPQDKLVELGFRPAMMVFEEGEVLFREGEVASAAYTLRSGYVKLTKSLANGRSQIVLVLSTGDLFGMDCLAGDNYHHNAIAITPSEVCRLPLKDLDSLRQQDPVIDRAILLRWAKSLRATEDLAVELGTKKAAERLASYLLSWCSGAAPDEWRELPLSRMEIGELLGLTIETVSRFFSEWRKTGLIFEQSGKIRIADPEKLARVARASGAY